MIELQVAFKIGADKGGAEAGVLENLPLGVGIDRAAGLAVQRKSRQQIDHPVAGCIGVPHVAKDTRFGPGILRDQRRQNFTHGLQAARIAAGQ